jgi:hypothetical protein
MAGAHGTGQRPATLAEIREMVGDLEAAKLEAILATGATPGQIEEAMAWAAGESDVMGGELERSLAGPVADVYEILASELPPLEDRD